MCTSKAARLGVATFGRVSSCSADAPEDANRAKHAQNGNIPWEAWLWGHSSSATAVKIVVVVVVVVVGLKFVLG